MHCFSIHAYNFFFTRELFRLLPFHHHPTMGSWVINNMYVARKIKGLRPECKTWDMAMQQYRYDTIWNSAMARTPLYSVLF